MVKKPKSNLKIQLFWSLGVSLAVFAMLLTPSVFFRAYWGKIYPKIRVGQYHLGGMTPSQATSYLGERVSLPEKIVLYTVKDGKAWEYEIKMAEIEGMLDLQTAVSSAYFLGRSGDIKRDVRDFVQVLARGVEITPKFVFDRNKLYSYLVLIADEVGEEQQLPYVELTAENTISVFPGKVGREVNIDELIHEISGNLENENYSEIEIKYNFSNPTLNESEIAKAQKNAESLRGKSLMLKHEEQLFSFNDKELVSFLDPRGGFFIDKLQSETVAIAEQVDRPAQNPVFVFEGGRVEEFKPSIDGANVTREQLASEIMRSVDSLMRQGVSELEVLIPVTITKSDINTEEVNNLGIKELIGKGESNFRGSIASRIYNVNLAASRLNGILIKPSEVFSFNKALGDVSKLTGYKEAYVISEGKTILGDGGGVCQVSTTLFRAALNAGLPIIERRAHSYRVYYYEQGYPVGLDSTVYDPTTDLKIKNDTGNYVLLQTKIDTKNMHLTFELYGANDGRIVEISKPVITQSTPPPPDQYVDDPNIAAGIVKQVEHSAWGAKVVFEQKVTKGGELMFSKKFFSTYKPWANVYLKGTGPTQ